MNVALSVNLSCSVAEQAQMENALPLENEDELYSGCYAQVSLTLLGMRLVEVRALLLASMAGLCVADGESLVALLTLQKTMTILAMRMKTTSYRGYDN